MAIQWKKVLLSGDVVNADINASAAIATSKLSGALTAVANHGLGTVAGLDTGLIAGTIPIIGTGGLEAEEVLVVNGAGTEMVGVAQSDAFNKPFGTIANTIAEGDHTHSLLSHSFTNHSDIAINAPSAGHVIYYNGGTWLNATIAGAGLATAGHNHTGTYALLAGDITQDFSVKNLTVAGDITQTTVSELQVSDKLVTLAYVDGGNGTPALGNGAGIQVDTSSDEAEFPTIYWDSTTGWKLKQGFDIDGNVEKALPTVRSHATAAPSSTSGVNAGDLWNKINTNEMYIAVGG